MDNVRWRSSASLRLPVGQRVGCKRLHASTAGGILHLVHHTSYFVLPVKIPFAGQNLRVSHARVQKRPVRFVLIQYVLFRMDFPGLRAVHAHTLRIFLSDVLITA